MQTVQELPGHKDVKTKMIYHIVIEADFRSRNDGQLYLPHDFGADGFVHCALEGSVLAVANDYFAAVSDTLLLLKIDPARLKSSTRYEAASPSPTAGILHLATSPVFPHVYGPIDNIAIDGIGILTKAEHGFEWPSVFRSFTDYFERHVGSSV
jgi:uncharacterized protein (DUF952 family)